MLSGCATKPQARPAVAPHVEISDNLRTGALCDGLRGRLPSVGELSVGELAAQWEGAEGFGACQKNRADQLVAIFDSTNAAWQAFADGELADD